MKSYSNSQLSDVKTIKLFTYRIHNISDDKPKFLIEKTYDITKSRLKDNMIANIKIEFSDVLQQLVKSDFGSAKQYETLNKDIMVVQPVHIGYNWIPDDDNRINSISFDIMNDIIDFNNVPMLCDYFMQERTLRNRSRLGENKPYYDHWSDRYMKLEVNPITNIPRLTLNYVGGGFNFETIYLKWLLPKGFNVMDTMDRLGGYAFSTTAQNVVIESNNHLVTPIVDISVGHVVTRVDKRNNMYLGLEHSTTKRLNGYVLKTLSSAVQQAIKESEISKSKPS